MATNDGRAGDRFDERRGLGRVFGSAPWLKPIDEQRSRTKLFRSGNSLAVRIPAGTQLEPGMEVELTVEHGLFVSLEPIDTPKRKFNVAKVAGSAKDLAYIDDDDRLFEERPLDWPARGETDGGR